MIYYHLQVKPIVQVNHLFIKHYSITLTQHWTAYSTTSEPTFVISQENILRMISSLLTDQPDIFLAYCFHY